MQNMIMFNFITYKQCLYTRLVNTLTFCGIVNISLKCKYKYKCKYKFMVIAAARLKVTTAAVVKN